jgi:hypothetical protein
MLVQNAALHGNFSVPVLLMPVGECPADVFAMYVNAFEQFTVLPMDNMTPPGDYSRERSAFKYQSWCARDVAVSLLLSRGGVVYCSPTAATASTNISCTNMSSWAIPVCLRAWLSKRVPAVGVGCGVGFDSRCLPCTRVCAGMTDACTCGITWAHRCRTTFTAACRAAMWTVAITTLVAS